MTESFKQQLQDLINQAAEKFDERNNQETDYYCPYSFKQGCEFLIPVLMKAVERRNECLKNYYMKRFPDVFDESYEPAIKLLNEELLQLLKGEK